jgi:hypothetical protein
MTDANTNSGRLDPLFHPAVHYASPDEVLNDEDLTMPEKRVLLSSWASDMFAVESCPSLREIPGMGHTVRLADIFAALQARRRGRRSAPTRRRPDAAAAAWGRRAGSFMRRIRPAGTHLGGHWLPASSVQLKFAENG